MIQKLRSIFTKYFPFSRGVVLGAMQYRVRFMFWVGFNFLSIAIVYFLWRAVFQSTEGGLQSGMVGSYSFSSMILYIFLNVIVANLTYVECSDSIADDIQDGSIAMRLIKPLSYRGQLFFVGLGNLIISLLFFALPFTVILLALGKVMGITGFSTNIWSILLFIVSLFLGCIVRYFVSFCFGMIIFFTINSFGVWQLREAIERILSGALVPIALFPGWMQVVCNFTPFCQYGYVPVAIFLGENVGFSLTQSLISVGIQLAWAIALGILSDLLWRKAIKRVIIQGG